jgi:hypothetical protein
MRPGSLQATTAVSAVTFANGYAAPECRMFEPSYETTVRLILSAGEVALRIEIYHHSPMFGRISGQVVRSLIFYGYDARDFPIVPHHGFVLAGVTPALP